MKNWKRFLAIAVLVCFAVALVPVEAHADALTAAMIGGLAYGVASGMGITFTAGNATGTGMSDYMAGQVESYVNEKGGSLSSLFQGSAAVTAAGKLLMANNLYNAVTDFIDWLGDKTGLSSNGATLSEGTYNGAELGATNKDTSETINKPEIPATGCGMAFWNWKEYKYGSYKVNLYGNAVIYNGGSEMFKINGDTGTAPTGAYYFAYEGNTVVCYYELCRWSLGYENSWFSSRTVATQVNAVSDTLSWSSPSDWAKPQPLPDNKQWEGDFAGTPGFAEPPTDLPDFLSRVPEAIANGTLDVTGQITEAETGGDPPFPSPSPSPQPGPSVNKSTIALIIAEIISVINSLTGDTAIPEEQIESIADSITESANTVPDAITQIGRETQTEIKDATTTITDTITDTTTEIKDAIQDQTQTQEDIKDAIQDLTDVPQDWEPQKRPLPRGVFPFCIPFDLHDFILALSAEPQTPEIHVPFDLQLPLPGGNVLPFHYQFDLDLHDFDGLAQVLRTLEFIAFGVGLLFVTGKVIKW